MDVVCLDLEGVLVPEIWIAVAQETGIEALQATTRDVRVYDDLMKHRLRVLGENRLNLEYIQSVIQDMVPIPGAGDFLDSLRESFQVVILSDTFYEFAKPLMARLGWPVLFCHHLEVAEDGMISGYELRQKDAKRQSVKAIKCLNFRVFAAGDSYNDTTMLEEADAGFLFRAPPHLADEFPRYPATDSYDTLLKCFRDVAAG